MAREMAKGRYRIAGIQDLIVMKEEERFHGDEEAIIGWTRKSGQRNRGLTMKKNNASRRR